MTNNLKKPTDSKAQDGNDHSDMGVGQVVELTYHQKRVLSFLVKSTLANLYQPDMQTIADHFRVSVPAIIQTLEWIEKKGWIRRPSGRTRSIEISANAVQLAKGEGK